MPWLIGSDAKLRAARPFGVVVVRNGAVTSHMMWRVLVASDDEAFCYFSMRALPKPRNASTRTATSIFWP